MSAVSLCVIFLSAAYFASGLNTNQTSGDALISDPSVAVETPPQDQDLQISITAMATPALSDVTPHHIGGEGSGEGSGEGEEEVEGSRGWSGEEEGSGDSLVPRVGVITKRILNNIGSGGVQERPKAQIWGSRYKWPSEKDQDLEPWQRWWLDRHSRGQLITHKLITPVNTEEEEDQDNPGVRRRRYEEYDVSRCPLLYYGQRYTHLYVNHSLLHSVVCFDGPASEPIGGDCVQMPLMLVLKLLVTDRARVLTADFNTHFPKVNPNLATCSMELSIQYTDKKSILKTYQFKDFSIFHLDAHVKGVTSDVVFFVKGQKWFSWILQGLDNVDVFLLPAACRQGDSMFQPSSVISVDPKTCSKTECDSMGRTISSSCGLMQTCDGNNSCIWDTLCCVLGPMLVDVSGAVQRVKDRCSYVLLNLNELKIEGSFRERRRRDVSFIHTLTFTVGPRHFLLEQGGRLSVNGRPLVLTSAPRVYGGMEVFQRDTGITMKFTEQRINVTLHSDGTMVQIRVQGLPINSHWGSCRNSSDLKPSNRNSFKKCDVSYPEPPDKSINRTAVNEWCQLVFHHNRFSSCHEEVHPQPFVDACVGLFSVYPYKDKLLCQLAQSYISICNQRLQGHPGYREIRITDDCVGASFVCQDFFCSDHEFCGISLFNDPYCGCRAIYAKPFRESGTYTLPVQCGLNSSSISLVTCLLEGTGFSPLGLRLQDPRCEGLMDPRTHMLTFSYDHKRPCGAHIKNSLNETVYKNAIVFSNSSSDVVTRQQDFHVSFHCVYANTKELSQPYMAERSSVSLHSSGFRDRMVQMKLFLNQRRCKLVGPKDKIELNTKVWLEVKSLEGDINLKLQSCWATPTADADGPLKHYLLQRGCPNPDDGTVRVERNGVNSISVVSFHMFQFVGHSNIIHLHCSLHVCRLPCPMDCSTTD